MRKVIIGLSIALFGATAFAADTQKVCVDQKDAKTQKTKQVCKEVKIHKKLEGTKVPPK